MSRSVQMTLMFGCWPVSRLVATVDMSTASTANPFSARKMLFLPLPQAISKARPRGARDQYFSRIGEGSEAPRFSWYREFHFVRSFSVMAQITQGEGRIQLENRICRFRRLH